MKPTTRGSLVVVGSSCLLIGWLAGNFGLTTLWAESTPAKAELPAFPMSARTGANIYLLVRPPSTGRAATQCIQVQNFAWKRCFGR